MEELPYELLIDIHSYLFDWDKFKFVESYNNIMKDKSIIKINMNHIYAIDNNRSVFLPPYCHIPFVISKKKYLKFKNFLNIDLAETIQNNKRRKKRKKRFK